MMAETDQDRWPSTAELDLQRRLEEEEKALTEESEAGVVGVCAPRAVEDNDTSAYVGVSSEYMTYANDTEKPLRSEEGPEADLEERLTEGGVVTRQGVPESNPTQGGGSTSELVYSATSGEGYVAQVAEETADDDDDEPTGTAKKTTRAKKATQPPPPPQAPSGAGDDDNNK